MKKLIDADALIKTVTTEIEDCRDILDIIDSMPDAYVVGLKTLDVMVQAAYKAGKEGRSLMVALNEEVAND